MQKKKIPEATGKWQLQEAKNRLSRVVGEARRGRPQTITLRGEPAAVVVSFDQYLELTRSRQPLSESSAPCPSAKLNSIWNAAGMSGREVEL